MSPAYIHPGDDGMLADPLTGLSPETPAMFGGRLQWSEPDDVKPLDDGAVLRLAGLEIMVDHAPGHTRGSVTFRLPGDDVQQVMLSGTCCSRAPSGAPTCPAATPTR